MTTLKGYLQVIREKGALKDHVTLVVLDLNNDEELLIFGPYDFAPGTCLTFDGLHVQAPALLEPTSTVIVNPEGGA